LKVRKCHHLLFHALCMKAVAILANCCLAAPHVGNMKQKSVAFSAKL
jgi:hypothetical protein